MFNKLFKLIKQTKNNRINFNKNSKYLSNGNYSYSNSLKYLYLNSVDTLDELINILENDPINTVSIKSSVFKKIFLPRQILIMDKLNEKSNQFIGSIYLFSLENKEDKIFDLENEKVMSILTYESDYNNKLKTYDFFKEYFTIPKIVSFEKKIIVEEFIPSKDIWSLEDRNSIMENLLFRYLKYFEKNKTYNEIIYKNANYLLNLTKTEEAKGFFKKTMSKQIMATEFPTIRLHGDLRKNNILLDSKKEGIYIIDWENTANYFIFYDLFFLMYHEAIYNNNYTIIKKYALGEYDKCFESIFAIYNLKYDKDKKVEYFNVFLLEHYIKKVNQNSLILNKYNEINDFFKKYD